MAPLPSNSQRLALDRRPVPCHAWIVGHPTIPDSAALIIAWEEADPQPLARVVYALKDPHGSIVVQRWIQEAHLRPAASAEIPAQSPPRSPRTTT